MDSESELERLLSDLTPKTRRQFLKQAALMGLSAPAVLALLANPAVVSTRSDRKRGENTVRAVVFGDFNGPFGSTAYSPIVPRVVDRIVTEWRPDIVLSPGDLVAGQKSDLPDARFPQMWSAFDAAVGGPLRRAAIPFGFALGNHDASAARGARGTYRFGRERDHAASYWRDPDHRPRLTYRDADHYPFYYSFTVQGIYVLVVDATTHVIQDAPWVLAALRSAEARAARMRIVMGHLPLYGVSEGRSRVGEVVEEGERWRRTFETLGVDLYISGHHAAYYPAHRGSLRLLHGGGGVGARPHIGHAHRSPRSTVTVMDIDVPTRTIALETFGTANGGRIPLSELPPCLDGYNGRVFRIDVPQAECPPRV